MNTTTAPLPTFLHTSDVVDPRVEVFDGPDKYEQATGLTATHDPTKPQKRWKADKGGSFNFLEVDPITGLAILLPLPFTDEEAAATNFTGYAKYPSWADFLAGRLAKPVNATLTDPFALRFGRPPEVPVGDNAYLFVASQAEAKALAAELVPPGTVVEETSIGVMPIVYAPGETRRVWGVRLASGMIKHAADLMQSRSQDPTVEKHGGVGQPVTITYAADGSPIYAQNLGPEPINSVMMPTPIEVPAGYAPGFAPQTFGGADPELGLVLITAPPVVQPGDGFTSADRDTLARIETRLAKVVA